MVIKFIFFCFLFLVQFIKLSECFKIKKFIASSLVITGLSNPVQAFPIFNDFPIMDQKDVITKQSSESNQNEQKINQNYIEKLNQIKLIQPDYFKLKEIEKTYITVDNNNIYFYGQVTSESCRLLAEKLNELNKNAKIFKDTLNENPPEINLHIQSPGGSLMNTFYIVDLINNLETPVNTYVDGYAASAASLISVSGKKRYMTSNSLILIHQLSGGNQGKFDEMDDEMKNLNLFMGIVKKIYLSKTNIKPIILEDILKHDIWLSSDQCKDLGIIDEII